MQQINFEEIVQQLLDKIDIVDVVSRYVNLKKSGKNYLGLCPFHSEKTPSFSVSPDKQIFKCFGCNKGGNVIHFYQEYEGVSFKEAMEILGREVGVDVKQAFRGSGDQSYKNEKLQYYDLLNEATRLYQKFLLGSDNPGMHYLKGRNFKTETIKMFQLGYAPDSWDALTKHLIRMKLPLKKAEEIGLISLSKSKNYIDKFRNRLMFPIFDLNRNIVGFGGRVLDKEAKVAKYINSSESIIYQKSKILYGLGHTKEFIRKEKAVIFVEGYFDFLRLFESGFKNVVATSGTAFTEDHARLIKRFTDTIYLCYDADEAGQKALLRAALMISNYDLNVKAVLLPDKEDPDSFIRKYGSNIFKEKMESAANFERFFVNYIRTHYDIELPAGKKAAIDFVIANLTSVTNDILRNYLIEEVAFLLQISPSSLIQPIQKQLKLKNRSSNEKRTITVEEDYPIEELELIVLLLQNQPDTTGLILSQISQHDFKNLSLQKLFIHICDYYDDTGEIIPSVILSSIPDTRLLEVISRKILTKYVNPVDYARDVIKKLQFMNLKRELEIISAQIKKYNNLEQIEFDLLEKYNMILEKIRKLQSKNE
ncbi:MAG: DNA primase [Calditrichia bacterium]